MGLIDKIRNASLQRRINKRIQENNISQATPEIVVQAIVEETMNNKVLVENTKTLQRLGILETASTWNIEQTLNHNKSIINLNTRVTTLEKVIEEQPKTKRADEVLDTSDNTYKDVKHIQVNRATKADMVLWPDTNEYYPVDELPFLAKFLTVNGGTITGNLEVNNQLTMNGDLVATQKWVQEHGGGGGSGDWKPTTDALAQAISNEETARMNKDTDLELKIDNNDTKINTRVGNLETKLAEWTNAVKFVHIEGNDINWSNTWTYGVGAIAKHTNLIFLSLKNDNLNHEPSLEDNEWWVDFGLVAQAVDLSDYYTKEEIEALLNPYATQEWVTQQLNNLPSGIDIKELKTDIRINLPNRWDQLTFEFDKPSDFNANTKYWAALSSTGDFNEIGIKEIQLETDKIKVRASCYGKNAGQSTITCKFFYVVGVSGGGSGGSSIDTSNFVRKDETWEQLCNDPCAWAQDLDSQIQSNGRLLGKMWDEGIVGGRAFGNEEQHIATKEWVEEELAKQPSDQPSISVDDIKKVVQEKVQDDSCVIYTAKNNPKDDNNTWITQYRYDGIRTRGNPQLEQNAKWLYIKHPTQPVWEGLGEEEHREVTLASEEWVIPKLHAINVIYNFQSTQIEKMSEDFVAYKYLVWNVKIKGFVDFVMKHWPQDELENIKHWGRVATFIPPKLFDIDWVRNSDGGTNYIDEHRTELIACSYDTNGDLILTIRVNGVADGGKYSQMINHLVLIAYKFGQPLLVTNDPTIDDEVASRPITEWKPKNYKLGGR